MSDYSGYSCDSENEALLQKAAGEVRKKKKGLRRAARDYGLDTTTLHHRVHGTRQSCTAAHTAQQLLTPTQECVLVEWVIYYSRSGHPLSQQAARVKAAKIIDGKPPSRKWYQSFLKRHPKLSDSRLQALDPKRARAFNPTTVDRFFLKLAAFLTENNIPPEHIWNMDEKGLQLNGGRKGDRTKYLIERKTSMNYKAQSDDIRMVMVIECVSTEGVRVPPAFIFKGARVQKRWFPQSNEDTTSEIEEALEEDLSYGEDEDEAQRRAQLHSHRASLEAGSNGRGADDDADDEGSASGNDDDERDNGIAGYNEDLEGDDDLETSLEYGGCVYIAHPQKADSD